MRKFFSLYGFCFILFFLPLVFHHPGRRQKLAHARAEEVVVHVAGVVEAENQGCKARSHQHHGKTDEHVVTMGNVEQPKDVVVHALGEFGLVNVAHVERSRQ